MNSDALARVAARTGTWLLPHAFPEGCPQHPSYAAGHATVAGACATLVKAFFDHTVSSVIHDRYRAGFPAMACPWCPTRDRIGAPLTIGGEMDKVAANIAIGRNHAGVHGGSDYADSLLLGEAVAISILRDQRETDSESFNGYTFTKFDGTRVTV